MPAIGLQKPVPQSSSLQHALAHVAGLPAHTVPPGHASALFVHSAHNATGDTNRGSQSNAPLSSKQISRALALHGELVTGLHGLRVAHFFVA